MSQQKTSTRKASIERKAKPDPLSRFRSSLKASRTLQDIKLTEGVKGIDCLVEDIEGDWLKNWDDEESKES